MIMHIVLQTTDHRACLSNGVMELPILVIDQATEIDDDPTYLYNNEISPRGCPKPNIIPCGLKD